MKTGELELTDGRDAREAAPEEDSRAQLLRRVERVLAAKPFKPHPLFRGAHAQTLAAFAWPRRFRLRAHRRDEPRLFEVEPGVKLLAHCRWQQRRAECPTLLLLHGLEGSSSSVYMLHTARLAYAAGFNVVRLNQRNCGATEHLTPTLYHSGLSADFRRVVNELIERDRLPRLFLAGFSMGGNLVMRVAGELGESTPREFMGVCAVSPSLDLGASVEAFNRRSNRLYQYNFMQHLRRRVRRKHRLYPELYDTRGLDRVRTLRQFDERYTARFGGYADAEDYYRRASALPLIPRIRTPTLVVHAQDDPLVPFQESVARALAANPFVITVAPPRGGHVAFLSDAPDEEERFWAEHLLVEFCRLINEGVEGFGAGDDPRLVSAADLRDGRAPK